MIGQKVGFRIRGFPLINSIALFFLRLVSVSAIIRALYGTVASIYRQAGWNA